MTRLATMAAVLVSLALAWPAPAARGDEAKLKDATRQVESGAKTVGSGVEETAKGVGHTVVEGAKTAGDKLKEASKAAEPQAKSAWHHVRDGAVSFGQSVKGFFSRLAGQ